MKHQNLTDQNSLEQTTENDIFLKENPNNLSLSISSAEFPHETSFSTF